MTASTQNTSQAAFYADLEKTDALPLDRQTHSTLDHQETAHHEGLQTGMTISAKPQVPEKPEVNTKDWNGPGDPDNPMNWPTWQKFYHAIAPALFGFAVTFGSSVYTPATADIMQHFHVSRTVAILGLTMYTLGLGFGPLVSAPLSEGHGRKIVYLVSSPIFMLFTMGAGFSRTFYSFCICRFFAGLTGSPALAIGAGTNADLFPPHQRAVATSMFLAAPFLGPAVGPVVGGFAAQYKGFRWTQWCMIFATLGIYAIAVPMKETYKPIILKKRAKKLGIKPLQDEPGTAKMKQAVVLKVIRPLHMLFTEPPVIAFALYNSFAFGVLFIFFAAFPYIFMRPPYSFTTSQSGLTFISIGIGVLIGTATGITIDRTMYMAQHRKARANGQQSAAPEHRLYAAMYGSAGLVVGLFWFGWCADKGVHWAVCLVGTLPFAWGNILIFTSAALYMVDVYGPLNGASAVAANGLARYIIGAVFPLFTVQMYEGMGIGWATSLLGFLALLMMPIPWIFFKYGERIRSGSKYPKII